jgi:hypothetical protein
MHDLNANLHLLPVCQCHSPTVQIVVVHVNLKAKNDMIINCSSAYLLVSLINIYEILF